MTIEDNLFVIKTQMQNAISALPKGHTPKLIAVSKKHPTQAIFEAYNHGLVEFAENYAQELEEKAQALCNSDIVWHFVGPIQSNKTRIIAEHASWVHSIDRLKIAKRLSQHCESLEKTLNVLVQVNISSEKQKSGVLADDLPALLESIETLPNITLRGLMCIPSQTHSHAEFAQMKNLFDSYQQRFTNFDHLSMGMSADYVEAITQGATMVRIGSALFGARPLPQAER